MVTISTCDVTVNEDRLS